ncbi:hypothetical protein [Pseudescherichia sp.]|uniref:hypothetical protein n=1 Tax=Pseudescherichia sp. TaxID=2055881 RepID=UPI0028A2D1B8|nr:hypothetical protein [Pseudescherichia sp.]
MHLLTSVLRKDNPYDLMIYGPDVSEENMKLTLMLFSLFSLCACSAFHTSKKQLDNGEPYWLTYDANYRGALIVPNGSPVRYCPEPPPDTATALALKSSASAENNSAAQSSGSRDYSRSIIELAKRTTTVEVLRYALFSICVGEMNGTISAQQREEMTDHILKAVVNISKSEFNDSVKEALKSAAEARKAGVEENVIQSITKK